MNFDSNYVTQEGYAIRVAEDVYLSIHDIFRYTTFSVKPVPMARATLFPRPRCLSAGMEYYLRDFMKREKYTWFEWCHVTKTSTYNATQSPAAPDRQGIEELK